MVANNECGDISPWLQRNADVTAGSGVADQVLKQVVEHPAQTLLIDLPIQRLIFRQIDVGGDPSFFPHWIPSGRALPNNSQHVLFLQIDSITPAG
ncbi:hypothetical protein D3C76_1539400 [compost metagenome]